MVRKLDSQKSSKWNKLRNQRQLYFVQNPGSQLHAHLLNIKQEVTLQSIHTKVYYGLLLTFNPIKEKLKVESTTLSPE